MKRFMFILLLLCTSCVAPQIQTHTAGKEPPRLVKGTLIASDNSNLPVQSWVPKTKPKAVILALHGFNDYSHAFAMPGEYMRLHGVAVFAYDQRGFGRSPNRGIWPGEDNLTYDVGSMVIAIKKKYPNTPVYVLGESMGGAVAVAAAIRPDFPKVDGIILSAPALWGGETMNPLFRITLWGAAHTVPSKKLTGEDIHILASDNIDMLRALGGDPLVIKATRVDTIYGLVQLMDTAYAHIDKVKVPMLVLYGAHDQVIPPTPIERSLRRMSRTTTRAAYYPLGYHMLLRDLHGDVPVRDILAWIDDKHAALPSGYEVDAKHLHK